MTKADNSAHMDGEHEIWISQFDDKMASIVCQRILNASRVDPAKPIILYIHSPGGYISSLRAIISTIKSVENPIITVAVGMAASAGCILLLCGDKRFVAPDSSIMFHEASGGFRGNVVDALLDAKRLEQENEYMWRLLEDNCGKKTAEILKKKVRSSERDVYLTAEQAVELKLADAIGMPLLVTSPTFHTQVFLHKKKQIDRTTPIFKKQPKTKKESK